MTTNADRSQVHLTPREKEVLTMLGNGLCVKDIASLLEVSVRTAGYHKWTMMQKLDLHKQKDVRRYAQSLLHTSTTPLAPPADSANSPIL